MAFVPDELPHCCFDCVYLNEVEGRSACDVSNKSDEYLRKNWLVG